MDGGSPVERFLRGTVYSAITRFCQWPVPFIPCRIGPRRGHALPGAQQDESRPGDARRVQPLGARDEPFADARGPAGDVIQKKRHVRADAGGQPDELRQGQRFGRAGVQPSKQRRRVRAPPSEPGPVRDAFFQHGLHARTEARSLGEQAVSLGQRVVFRINARFRAVERQPASRPQGKPERVGRLVQRQEYRIQLMPSVGAHPRNPQGQVHLASDPQCRRFHRSVIHPDALPARVALFV